MLSEEQLKEIEEFYTDSKELNLLVVTQMASHVGLLLAEVRRLRARVEELLPTVGELYGAWSEEDAR